MRSEVQQTSTAPCGEQKVDGFRRVEDLGGCVATAQSLGHHVEDEMDGLQNTRRAFNLLSIVILTMALGGVLLVSEGRLLFTLTATTFVINHLVLAVLIARTASKGPVGLCLVHLFAVWLMLVVAPFATYLSGEWETHDFFGSANVADDFLLANLIVLVWVSVFIAVYSHAERRRTKVFASDLGITRPRLVILVSAAVGTLAYLASLGDAWILTRGGIEGLIEYDTAREFVLFQSGMRGVSYVALGVLLVKILDAKSGETEKWILIGLAVAMGMGIAAFNNPLAAARYFSGTVGVGVLFLLWWRRSGNALSFIVVMLIMIFLLFPLDFGRMETDYRDALDRMSFSFQAALVIDNYRTYEAIPAAARFVEHVGSTNGWQLVGNLLFWVPREVWTDKPVGSGTMLAIWHGSAFTNVACPLQCEALVNFGYVGIPAFAAAAAAICEWCDRRFAYFHALSRSGRPSFYIVVYAYLLGTVFYITRGDLLSPLSYVVIFLGPSAIVMWARLPGGRRPLDTAPLDHTKRKSSATEFLRRARPRH